MKNDITISVDYRYKGVNEAARRFGVSPSHLSRILRGEREPGKKLAGRLDAAGIDYRKR